MKEKGINFYQGHICVKNVDGSLSFVSDSCIPKLKERIDIFIESNPKILNVKDIIFTVLKDYFKISKTFVTPNNTSIVNFNDTLYTELTHYISQNPTYRKNIENQNHLKKSRSSSAFKKRQDYIIFSSYERDKRQRLKKIAH